MTLNYGWYDVEKY